MLEYMLRRYIECWIVVLCPWVLLTECYAVPIPGTEQLKTEQLQTVDWFCSGLPADECGDCQTYGRCPTCLPCAPGVRRA